MASIKKPSSGDKGMGSEPLRKGDNLEGFKLPQGGVQIVNKELPSSSEIHRENKYTPGTDSADSIVNGLLSLDSLAITETNPKMKTGASRSAAPAESLEALMAQIREQQHLIDSQKKELASKNREVNILRGAAEPELQIVGKEPRALKESSSSRLNLSAKIPISPFVALQDDLDENPQMVLASETENMRSNYKAGDLKAYYQPDLHQYMSNSYSVSDQGIDDATSESASNRASGGARSGSAHDTVDRTIHNLQTAFSGHSRPFINRGESWPGYPSSPEEPLGATTETQPITGFNQVVWTEPRSHSNPNATDSLVPGTHPLQSSAYYAQRFTSKPHDGSLANSSNNNKRTGYQGQPQSEQHNYDWQPGSGVYRSTQFGPYPPGASGYVPHYSGQSQSHPSSYNPSVPESTSVTNSPGPIGTHLSPTAAEFRSTSTGNTNVWNTSPNTRTTSYGYHDRAASYRTGSGGDRGQYCDWNLLVEKILSENDQQSSLFLQQRLKLGTQEQKYAIIDAIIERAYPLMVNRFGNFLVQRCFEHGTQRQIDAIAMAMKGKTLQLSMDAFGCHVVQKAFDSVNESFKATMVHELLRRIPETVIHRYACHVWQKLFELRWVDSPPQIMKYVNEALKGMWPDVALGETGSLVVQNIFENCLEEDKRPCINEVLMNIELIARGQYGNWCIQHICEHGAPPDRAMAIDNVIMNATEYSMDQFASKVVEKCLKAAGPEFLDRYLDRVCEGRPDRPRIPLIDIASDQYGNYLVQHIIQTAAPHHRDIVASHIRKHMVSLRGSKFGSRVGMLCAQNFNKPSIYPPPPSTTGHRYTSHGGSGRWNHR